MTPITKSIYALALILLLFTACNSYNINKLSRNEITSKIPKKYSVESAIANGDVVNVHGNITNLNKLEQFIENVNNKNKDSIRIVMYTIEGDPIIQVLNYDGNIIKYSYDNSRDAFGGSDKGVINTEGINIEKEEKTIVIDDKQTTKVITVYYLTGSSDRREILSIN